MLSGQWPAASGQSCPPASNQVRRWSRTRGTLADMRRPETKNVRDDTTQQQEEEKEEKEQEKEEKAASGRLGKGSGRSKHKE